MLPDGVILTIEHKRRDMYYIEVAPPPEAMCNLACDAYMAADYGYANRQALIWNMRLLLTPQSLKDLPNIVIGTGIQRVTPEMQRIIEHDTIRSIANARRSSHPRTQAYKLASKPGEVAVLDAWSYRTASAVLGCAVLLGVADECSGMTLALQTKRHRTQEYVSFMRTFGSLCASANWVLKAVQKDNAPELNNDEFEREMNIDKVHVRPTTSYTPERQGRIESVWGAAEPDAVEMMG